jgi:hypothetical protein
VVQLPVDMEVIYNPVAGRVQDWTLENIFSVVCGDKDLSMDLSLLPMNLMQGII